MTAATRPSTIDRILVAGYTDVGKYWASENG